MTFEGHTYQPYSESIEPDIENLQVIGISEGNTSRMAFENLIKENIDEEARVRILRIKID